MGRGRKIKGTVSGRKLPPLVYGLKGIQDLFDVSKTTASRYKNTIIKDAVTQQGGKIVIDTAEALRLFGLKTADKLIQPAEVLE